MLRVTEIVPAGHWDKKSMKDEVTLDYEERHRRRRAYTGAWGTEFLLDMAETVVLRDGDGLKLEDGSIVAVRAAKEQVVEISAHSAHELVRLAWHLGNRHLPTQIDGQKLFIRDDHVIVDMLKGLGAHVRHVSVPFDPEGGAYGQQNHDHRHPHAHSHAHDDHHHGHDHDHDHDHHHDH